MNMCKIDHFNIILKTNERKIKLIIIIKCPSSSVCSSVEIFVPNFNFLSQESSIFSISITSINFQYLVGHPYVCKVACTRNIRMSMLLDQWSGAGH